MERYKLLKDCLDGEWVYYEVGRLCQVQDYINSIDGRVYKDLVDGYIRTSINGNTKVYPLTINNKIIAEAIHHYYELMHEKRLINGSKWINWLSDKYDELMALDDYAKREDYRKIYDSIEAQIKELEYHKSFL
jgi:hypothetical protein